MIDIQALPVELQEILAQMQDTTPDLDDGKHPALVLYSEVKQLLATSHGHESHQRARNIAESLVRLSEEQIRSYNYRDVPRGWREMLTDATVYWAIATLADDDDETEQSQIAAVGRLDRAIIVAGDTGSVRERVVFTLIKLVQSRLHHAADDDRPKKRRRLAIAQPLEAPYITHAIPRFGNGLSLNEFTSQCIDGPFIISEGCADWPAVERWREVAYLRQIAGRGRVVPVEIGDDYTSDNWGQEIRSLDAVLDSLWSASPNDEPKLYLAQHDLFRQLPDLRRDVIAPDYVYTAPPAPGDAPEYRPPAHEDGYILNAWLGPPGTLSPAHTDPYYNCYAQVVGSKWIWVAPPKCSSHMSTFSSSGAHEEQDNAATSATSHLLTNTTRLDVTLPPESRQLPDSFKKHVAPVSMQAVLKTGDLLCMPPGWWHSMKSLERSFSVSIWF